MKKILCLLTLMLGCYTGSALAATSAAQQLSFVLKQYSSYSADFSQLTFDAQHRLTQRSHGNMQLKKPGLFRWETVSPNHQIVINDGKWLWVYDVDLAQVTKKSAAPKGQVDPARLLAGGVADLNAHFKVSLVVASNQRKTFSLTPLQQKSGFTRIDITFNHYQLTQLEMLNDLGQTSVFNFSKIQLNPKLKPTYFEFKPPAGVDVLNADE